MAGYYYDYRGGGFVHPLPINLASQCHFPVHGSLKCPLVGLSDLLQWVFPPPGPRLEFCSSLWHILLKCGGVALPMQLVPQTGQDVLDCLFSLLGPRRQWTRQSSQQVYIVVEVSDLLVGSLFPYKFYGRCVCLWVWPLVGSASSLIK